MVTVKHVWNPEDLAGRPNTWNREDGTNKDPMRQKPMEDTDKMSVRQTFPPRYSRSTMLHERRSDEVLQAFRRQQDGNDGLQMRPAGTAAAPLPLTLSLTLTLTPTLTLTLTLTRHGRRALDHAERHARGLHPYAHTPIRPAQAWLGVGVARPRSTTSSSLGYRLRARPTQPEPNPNPSPNPNPNLTHNQAYAQLKPSYGGNENFATRTSAGLIGLGSRAVGHLLTNPNPSPNPNHRAGVQGARPRRAPTPD